MQVLINSFILITFSEYLPKTNLKYFKINSYNASHVFYLSYNMTFGRSKTEIARVVNQAVSRRPLSAEIPLRS